MFVLQNLAGLVLREGIYAASLDSDPTASAKSPAAPLSASFPLPQLIRSVLLRSPLAHLYELHPLLTSLLTLSITSPSITSAYIPYRQIAASANDNSIRGLPIGFEVGRVGRVVEQESLETDVVKLVLTCLNSIGKEIGCPV